MNRRELMIGSVATAALVALPIAAVEAAIPAARASVPLPAWAVGTPGEWDWEVIEAATEHGARVIWVEAKTGLDQCEDDKTIDGECDCEFCYEYHSIDADRKVAWDGKGVTAGGTAWFASGMGACCDRCSHETSRNECGHVVGNDVVCQDCLTLADWDSIDPEHAAELRAEAEEPSP